MRRAIRTMLGAGAVALATSCVMVMDPDRPTAWQPRGEFRKTVEFPPGSTLIVENGSGDIEITGWETETLEVAAVGTPGFPAAGQRIRAYGLWRQEPRIEVLTTATGIRIRPRALDGPGPPPRVDFRIRVPHSVLIDEIRAGNGNISISDVYGRVMVSLGRGDVTVKNFSGPVDISVESGAADVEALDVRDGDKIAVTTGQGDIMLRLEAGTGGTVDARAPRGLVRSDFDLGVELPAPEVSGRMGSGGAAVALETREGDIDILLVKEVMRNHG